MHVGLNLIFLVPGETGGMEVYARELIPELIAARPQWRFTAFVNRELAATPSDPLNAALTTVTVPVAARSRFQWVRGEQQLLPRIARRAGVDLVHSLANTAPLRGKFKRVVTIHDLHYRLVPEAHFGLLGLGMRLLVPLGARRSDRVIAISANTARDIERLLKLSASKVDVVPNGLGARVRVTPLDEKTVRERFSLGEQPVVLTVSAKRPHKNLLRLLAALAAIPVERRPMLVLPGYSTPHEDELKQRAAALGVLDQTRFLGWLSEEELEGLYAVAACFVFPSLHEGFGLPVLEAMARGVPVACSDRSSLPEVAGSAALLFDPEDVGAITAAIEQLLSDPTKAQQLRTAGYAQAERFTWAAAAAGTADAYERTLAA